MEKKRWRMVFVEKSGYARRIVISYCTEEELSSRKAEWAKIIKDETGRDMVCVETVETAEGHAF